MKSEYDKAASEYIDKYAKEQTKFTNFSGLFTFNLLCMMLDSCIIVISSVSLLKYSSMRVKRLE